MFKVGDRVRIISSARPRMIGVETVVISGLVSRNPATGNFWAIDGKRVCGHLLDIASIRHSGNVCYRPESLELIDDGNDLVSWESMKDVWVPRDMAIAEHVRAFCPTADEYQDV